MLAQAENRRGADLDLFFFNETTTLAVIVGGGLIPLLS